MLITSTTYPWWHQFDVRPYPSPLDSRPPWLAVVEPTRRGIWMLERLIADDLPVGPVMACALHDRLRIPVEASDVNSPLAARLTMTDQLECAREPYASPCPGQFWMLPPHHSGDTLTAVGDLHDSLHRLRAAWSRPAASAA